MDKGTAALLMLCVSATVYCQKQIDPPHVWDYDGLTWAGIEIGRTTKLQVQQLYKLDEEHVWPNSASLSVRPHKVQPHVLFDGRGSSAVVRSVLIDFRKNGPDLRRSRILLGGMPTKLYDHERVDPWHLEVYWDRGIVLFVFDWPNGEVCDRVLLCPPEQLAVIVQGMVTDAPGANDEYVWARTAGFRRILVDSSEMVLGNGRLYMAFDDRVRRHVMDLASERQVSYTEFRGGIMRILIKSEGDEGRSTLHSVSVGLDLLTPYGKIRSHVEMSRRNDYLLPAEAVELIEEGVRELLDELESKIRAIPPTRPKDATIEAVKRIIGLATISPPN